MDRRPFILMSAPVALAPSLAAWAQPTGKIYHLGTLVAAPPLTPAERAQSPLRAALRGLGWIDGQSIRYHERRSLIVDQLVPFAAELVEMKMDAIFAYGVSAVRAAQRATTSVPIVMLVGPDPVAERLLANLQRPGGNVTGVTTLSTDLIAKRIGLIKELVPRVSRVAYIVNPSNPGNVSASAEIAKVAAAIGIAIQSVSVRSSDELERAFAMMSKEPRVDAAMVGVDGMLVAHRTGLAELAARHRIPVMYSMREYAEAGGLMAYTADYSAVFQRVAVLIDKILRGAKPAELPVEQPTKFELVLNMKTARTLGITIPPSLLLRADHVIE